MCELTIDGIGSATASADAVKLVYWGPSSVCGNNSQEGTEECDGSDDAACLGLCRSDCTCPVCGDGIKDSEEVCDGMDFGGSTCESLGYDSFPPQFHYLLLFHL